MTDVVGVISALSFVGMVVAIAVYAVIGVKCPDCAKRRTIRYTGDERPSEIPGVKTELRWECRSCESSGWSPKVRSWTLLP